MKSAAHKISTRDLLPNEEQLWSDVFHEIQDKAPAVVKRLRAALQVYKAACGDADYILLEEWPRDLQNAVRRWARLCDLTKGGEPPGPVWQQADAALSLWRAHPRVHMWPVDTAGIQPRRQEKGQHIHGDRVSEHYVRWAVLFQWRRRKVPEIAGAEKATRANVRRGISRVLETLAVDRRRVPGGRPIKTTV